MMSTKQYIKHYSKTHTWKYLRYGAIEYMPFSPDVTYTNIWECSLCGIIGTSEEIAPDVKPVACGNNAWYTCNNLILEKVLK